MDLVGGQPVWAAGAVVQRGSYADRQVLVVHRPAYDDWTLPKGKAHPGELLPTTAVREVREESAVRVRLGAALTPIRYPIGATMKLVSWWVGIAVDAKRHTANTEVDEVRWMSSEEAAQTLSYCDERDVLAEAISLPETTPLIILRHAKAVDRLKWHKRDLRRPLSKRGWTQLPYVSQILAPFGVSALIASTATRCVETLSEYAKSNKLKIATEDLLSEDGSDRQVGGYITGLARTVGASTTPTAVCSHLPQIAAMLSPLGIQGRYLATASCVIAHLDHQGTVVRAEWHDTLRVKQ